MNYGHTKGLDVCLSEVAEYLRKSRNLLNKDYVVTNGSQEALFIACKTFIKPGERIAVEKKGYPAAWRLFESLGAIPIPIKVDAEGLNTDDLQAQHKKGPIKLIYVTPLHQYPTTVTLSPRRRQSLIQFAEHNLIPILEDDYDNEFHYSGPPPPPLAAETDLGIYVCSFSKVLFPGARLGVIGCDSKVLPHLSFNKYLVSRQTDGLSQIALSSWMRDGGFFRHLRKMRRTYEGRLNYMVEELQKIKAECDIDWLTPNGGMSVWVNTFRDSEKITELGKRQGGFFQHERAMDYNGTSGTHLRIGFAGVNEREISEGLALLKTLLRKAHLTK